MNWHSTAVSYQTSMIEPPQLGFSGNWLDMDQLLEPTDTKKYAVKPFGVSVDVPTIGGLSSETMLSLSSLVQRLGLQAQLKSLQLTPEKERWPDADWPSAQAFKDAETFITNLNLALIPMPHICLANDGEVNFFWKDGTVHVDLGFYGTCTFSYFARGRDGSKLYGEEIPACEGLPSKVEALFAV